MKKQILMIFLCLLLVLSFIQSSSATTVFLTSDHVGTESNDLDMLNSVKNYIEEISDGQIEVVVDSQAPSPGEGSRAIEASADVSVNFAACCSGNLCGNSPCWHPSRNSGFQFPQPPALSCYLQAFYRPCLC